MVMGSPSAYSTQPNSSAAQTSAADPLAAAAVVSVPPAAVVSVPAAVVSVPAAVVSVPPAAVVSAPPVVSVVSPPQAANTNTRTRETPRRPLRLGFLIPTFLPCWSTREPGRQGANPRMGAEAYRGKDVPRLSESECQPSGDLTIRVP